MALLLAGFVLVTAVDVEAANPHRRGAPLDRLKRRSASARWDELRQTWRFDHADDESTTAEPASQNVPEAGEPVANRPTASVAPRDHSTPHDNAWQSTPPVGAAAHRQPEWTPFPGGHSIQSPGTVPALPPLPIASESGPFRPFSDWENELSAVSQDPQAAGDDSIDGQIATPVSVLPKSITSILPYYDYAPGGEDPCEFCPRPAGCPESDDARPCPKLVSMPEITSYREPFVPTHVAWEPANLFHNPLYFEDHALERYGHTHCDALQPFVSVSKFSAQLIGLPYQMALHPIHERQYTLGWHRPGECVPYRYYLPPWNTKAAITAGAAYTGLIFLIP
ncbi:MAG: hypothetical protein KF861_14725 [Planctomycetaceae bacterium]|nr:hypothetical protein [Planctomycetaceae bacterium]